MSEKRERGTGRLFLRGQVWWAQYYLHGQQVRVSTKETDEAKAKKFLRKKIGAKDNGIQEDSRSLRYETIRDAYLNDCAVHGKKSLRHDRQGRAYLESVKRLDPFFDGCRAVEISSDLMRQFQREMKAEGYANGSINRSLASLRKMFTLAQQDERIRHVPHFPMLPESDPRQGILPAEKYPQLLAALPGYLHLVVSIGFHTGMRLGEILALTWTNIIWIDRAIRLERKATKNKTAREIPFSADLERMLREQYNRRQPGCDLVCYRIDRLGHARGIGDFRKVWRRVCVRLGLAKWEPVVDKGGEPVFDPSRYAHSRPKQKMVYTGLIFHDLRRSFITAAERAGAPRHEAMEISGHKTESVYKRYVIGNLDQRRAALEAIEQFRAGESRGQNGDNSVASKSEQSVVH
jgi:integrase